MIKIQCPFCSTGLLMASLIFVSGSATECEAQSQPAHSATVASNQSVKTHLNFTNRQDFVDSKRGFIATNEPLVIKDKSGEPVWDMNGYDFLSGETVDTVNPSLWRQEQLNNIHGLFKIHDKIYQVRNFDLANMTLIEGRTGWIVIDTLLTKETARAAFDLATRHLGEKPIKAIIYTHSHADHFGGVRGLVTDAQVASGKVKIIAPAGFMEFAIAENVLAGNAMSRRASYQFGNVIAPGPQGQVGTGLGKTTSSGAVGLIPPTDTIEKTGQEMVIDGVRIVFQMANGSEAPAEFMFYFPDFKALCLSEVTTHHMHNIVTLRGAQVRDALGWSKYINETIDLFGNDAELAFASHHWPTWGKAEIRHFLGVQRDLYRFIHDETLRLANLGLTPKEISEEMKLPASLAGEFSVRGYYGTLSHNVKAVYQRYFGWYDGNPAHLHPLPPTEAGKRYVEFMGGADNLLQMAQKAYDGGEFRWVAEVVNHLVFADPENEQARTLQANALEQLGYQAESGVWRNEYLAAASELRHGVQQVRMPVTGKADIMRAVSLDMLFDFFGVRLKRHNLVGKKIAITMDFTDIGVVYALELGNGVLNNTKGRILENADATYHLSTQAFAALLGQKVPFIELVGSGKIKVEGNPLSLGMILTNLEIFDPYFNIVTP